MLIRKSGDRKHLEDSLRVLFADVFQQISKRTVQPEINVNFYPFAGLNHTIRIRNQQVFVRISDILQDAPPIVYQALANILVRKLFKRRPKIEYETVYRQYIYQPQILRASELAKQSRGRKHLNGFAGRVYNLDEIFTRLNYQYFGGALSTPVLGWSKRHTKRILGHHDAIHDTIVISRSLDKKSVPDYIVEYVMYHEMLHIKHPSQILNGRRIFHSPAFRAEEKQFACYEKAIKWLEISSQRSR